MITQLFQLFLVMLQSILTFDIFKYIIYLGLTICIFGGLLR